MTFRTPAAETEGTLRIRFALMSTYAILAQLMEDMLHPQPTETRQAPRAERNKAAPWPDENRRGINHQFHFGVVIVPQLPIGLGAMSDLSPDSLQERTRFAGARCAASEFGFAGRPAGATHRQ